MIPRFAFCILALAAFGLEGRTASAQAHQATGVKIGEVTADSAVVWTRLTHEAERNAAGRVIKGRPPDLIPPGVAVEDLEGAAPGASGRIRVRYGLSEGLGDARATDWASVTAATDFTHSFRLTGLSPATRYYVSVEAVPDRAREIEAVPDGPTEVEGVADAATAAQAIPDGQTEAEPLSAAVRAEPLSASFRTAPLPADRVPALFTAVTCQFYGDLDTPRGFRIYETMLGVKPDFLLSIGDNVYYDTEAPRATTPAVARYHWQRMYSLPLHFEFLRRVPGFWLKDDHDTLDDDCWPGRVSEKMAPMTFEQGASIFLEQVPMGNATHRSARWGRAVELWLTEGRDFRSPNTIPDGPEKTIWGREQKRWLMEEMLASDADWKILVSPTPIVGPDRSSKADNHANAAFAHEGREFRRWAAENLGPRFFVVCGDRHWQYHSVDPETGVQEFSCGPASDAHASGSPGEDPAYHRFHRVAGGFLSVAFAGGSAGDAPEFRFHDAQGEVVYRYRPGAAKVP